MFSMSIPQKPYKIEINLNGFPIRRAYASFVTEMVELTPGFYRLVVFCILRAEEPLEYAEGMALLSDEVFSMAELEEIAFTEAVMKAIWFYVSGLPVQYQVKAEGILLEKFLAELKRAKAARQVRLEKLANLSLMEVCHA
jgi:hypothetical protein